MPKRNGRIPVSFHVCPTEALPAVKARRHVENAPKAQEMNVRDVDDDTTHFRTLKSIR
jgi:hypothetical protein